jgi:hypothetical protein
MSSLFIFIGFPKLYCFQNLSSLHVVFLTVHVASVLQVIWFSWLNYGNVPPYVMKRYPIAICTRYAMRAHYLRHIRPNFQKMTQKQSERAEYKTSVLHARLPPYLNLKRKRKISLNWENGVSPPPLQEKMWEKFRFNGIFLMLPLSRLDW